MGLTGARALVVGASAGIGRAIGVGLAAKGADVAFAARRRDLLDEAVSDAGTGYAVVMDVTDQDSVVAGVERAHDLLGGLDLVVYASGVASMAPVAEETPDGWRRMFDTNVVGAALVVRQVIPVLGDAGIVLACSSSNTHRRLWGLAGYGATKAALDRLVEGLRDEHPGVRFVRAVIGPTFGTEFGDRFDGDTLMEAMPRWVVAGQQPATMMRPDDVAAVVVDVLATMRANPGVDIPVLPLDPPGGPALLPADGAALQLMLDVLTDS